MGFARTREELPIQWRSKGPSIFYRAEVTSILYETKSEILRRVLPPPLEPYDKPYVILNFNDFPRVAFGSAYKEPALMIPAQYQGVPGMYTLAMILDQDIGIYCGRSLGYPKKYGTIKDEWRGDVFTGSWGRNGIMFATMNVNLGVAPNDTNAEAEFARLSAPAGAAFKGHKKHGINWVFLKPDTSPWEIWDEMMKPDAPKARLMRHWKAGEALEPARYGSGSIKYVWSDDDPWAELEVVKVIGARRTVSKVMLLDSEVAAEVSAKEYAPHAYHGWDAYQPEYMDPCPEKE